MADASPERFTIDRISTPIGVALFVTDSQGSLTAFDWEDFESRLVALFRARGGSDAALSPGKADPAVRESLERYFAGEVHAIDSLRCNARGTPFQQTVWAALRRITTGTTA